MGTEPLQLGATEANWDLWKSGGLECKQGKSFSTQSASGFPPPQDSWGDNSSSVEPLAQFQRLRFLIHRKASRLHVPLEKSWGLAL